MINEHNDFLVQGGRLVYRYMTSVVGVVVEGEKGEEKGERE